jgi:hypothetical protein
MHDWMLESRVEQSAETTAPQIISCTSLAKPQTASTHLACLRRGESLCKWLRMYTWSRRHCTCQRLCSQYYWYCWPQHLSHLDGAGQFRMYTLNQVPTKGAWRAGNSVCTFVHRFDILLLKCMIRYELSQMTWAPSKLSTYVLPVRYCCRSDASIRSIACCRNSQEIHCSGCTAVRISCVSMAMWL